MRKNLHASFIVATALAAVALAGNAQAQRLAGTDLGA